MRHLSKSFAQFFLLFALMVFGGAVIAQPLWQVLPETINKSENDPRIYQSIKLNNGMIVLLVSDPKATKSLAAVSIPVGSLENPDSQLGLAHYLEHMILMGSKNIIMLESVLAFINALIESPEEDQKRVLLRSEFSSCGIKEIIRVIIFIKLKIYFSNIDN